MKRSPRKEKIMFKKIFKPIFGVILSISGVATLLLLWCYEKVGG